MWQPRDPAPGHRDRPVPRQRPVDHLRPETQGLAGTPSGSRTTSRCCSSADEAVSLAAASRLCAMPASGGQRLSHSGGDRDGREPSLARDLDRRLHAERIHRGTHRRRLTGSVARPSGRRVRAARRCPRPRVRRDVRYLDHPRVRRPPRRPRRGDVDVITPPTSLAALSNGYHPQVDHPRDPDANRPVRALA